MRNDEETRSSGFGKGFLIGGLIGAGIALLYAPKRGTELREDVRNKANDLKSGVGRLARSFRRQTDGVLEKTKESLNAASDVLERQRDHL